MEKRIEEIKQKMKNDCEKKVDEFFAQITEMNESGSFNINEIEKLLGNGIAAAKEALKATTEEVISSKQNTESDPDGKKKHVPPVKEP